MKRISIFSSSRFLFQEGRKIDRDAVKAQQPPEDERSKYLDKGRMRPEEVAKVVNFLSDSSTIAAIPEKLDVSKDEYGAKKVWSYERDGIKIETSIIYKGGSIAQFAVTFLKMNDNRSNSYLPGAFCWLKNGQISVIKHDDGRVLRPISVSYYNIGLGGSTDGTFENPQHDAAIRKFVTEFLRKNFK